MTKRKITCWIAGGLAISAAAPADEPWTTARTEGRIEVSHRGRPVFAWQKEPLGSPKGGAEKFAASAFVHPLRTPGGFVCTAIQPDDHLHHFGLWWPWKFIEVEGRQYNCWEIQEGQGAHVARDAKRVEGDDNPAWEFLNEMVVKKPGERPRTAIREKARVASRVDGDALLLDIAIDQEAAGPPVTIVEYRYSGFSWRGPLAWNKDNSRMTTSEGKGRDDANGTTARWVVVSGPADTGEASVLMMSAAEKLAGGPEKLRVWDASGMNGNPFVNFNPVMEMPLPLDADHPAVAKRKYRLVVADHRIDAAEAEDAWRKWMAE